MSSTISHGGHTQSIDILFTFLSLIFETVTV